MAKKETKKPAMRIKFRSYDLRMLDATVAKVMAVLIKSGPKVKGPIPLPKKEDYIQYWELHLYIRMLENNLKELLILDWLILKN